MHTRPPLATPRGLGWLIPAALLAADCAGGDALPIGCTLFLPADSGCHRHERELLTAAWREVAARVCGAPAPFVRCFAEGTYSPAERADVETVAASLRQSGWTTLRCADLARGRDAEGRGSDDGATIRVDHGYLAGGKDRRPLVETLAHEMAHTLGYAHHGAEGAGGEHRWSVPVRFEACARPAVEAIVSEAPGAVTLAPLGVLGDGVERDRGRWCAAGATASSVSVAEAGGVTTALSLGCRDDRTGVEVRTPLLDAVAARPIGCGADVLVGVRAVRAERGVLVRQALCLPRTSLVARNEAGLTARPPLPGVALAERRCPRGTAVRGLVATGTASLERLQVWCGPIGPEAPPSAWTEGERVGARMLPAATARTWRCDEGRAVGGLFGQLVSTRDGIVRLGAVCRATPPTGLGDDERVLPALGTAPHAGDVPLGVRCPEGHVAVGIRARSTRDGAIPLRVGLLCDSLRSGGTPVWRDDGHPGAVLGAEARCPPGAVVAGLALETTPIRAAAGAELRVSTLQPLCRAGGPTR